MPVFEKDCGGIANKCKPSDPFSRRSEDIYEDVSNHKVMMKFFWGGKLYDEETTILGRNTSGVVFRRNDDREWVIGIRDIKELKLIPGKTWQESRVDYNGNESN